MEDFLSDLNDCFEKNFLTINNFLLFLRVNLQRGS